MARNEKGEDWAKYLKEIRRLTPMVSSHMGGGSAAPINSRQAARAAGFRNLKDAQESIAETERKHDAIEAHKAHLVNQWFSDQLAARLPAWLLKLAGRRQWVLKSLGFRWGFWDHMHQEDGMRKPMPATVVWLKWAHILLAENNLVWDNPDQNKRRIITLS